MANDFKPLSLSATYFELLGVGASVTSVMLAQRLRDLSRAYHPDRWATADAETQAQALDATAFLNDAYRTLKDPFTRAEYLLRRERGVNLADGKNAPKPPAALLGQVMELQESLMEYQEARLDDDEAQMARLRPDLEAAKTDFEATYTAMAERLQSLFERWDAGAERESVLDEIATVVSTRGYLRRVLTNLQGTLS